MRSILDMLKGMTNAVMTGPDVHKIGDLPSNPAGCVVYLRQDPDLPRSYLTYLRLNEKYHVKVGPGEKPGVWIGDGRAEEIDLDEMVRVLK